MKKLTQGLAMAAAVGFAGAAQAAYIGTVANTAPAEPASLIPSNNDYANGNGLGTDFIPTQYYDTTDSVLLFRFSAALALSRISVDRSVQTDIHLSGQGSGLHRLLPV